MNWFWTWRGVSFGYRIGNSLFTHQGDEVAHFEGDELYGIDGAYLGEVLRGDRLVTRPSKHRWNKHRFLPVRRLPVDPRPDCVAHVMYCGYRDFPSPECFASLV